MEEEKVELGLLPKDPDRLMEVLEQGGMAAVLSGSEVMYVFDDGHYQCFIHPLDADEGRRKTFEKDEPGRAVIRNLANLCDQLFQITYDKSMHYMGVMVAAERGIINYLDVTGQLPADDVDFMTGEVKK